MPADRNLVDLSVDEFIESARMFYFDTALTDGQFALPLLKKFAKPDHILFGSDFPYTPSSTIKFMTQSQKDARLDEADKLHVAFPIAGKIFPRLLRQATTACSNIDV